MGCSMPRIEQRRDATGVILRSSIIFRVTQIPPGPDPQRIVDEPVPEATLRVVDRGLADRPGARKRVTPDQQTELPAAIVQPEGRVHFAGEHCSLYHAWIQGALESGIRAATEIHEARSDAAATE